MRPAGLRLLNCSSSRSAAGLGAAPPPPFAVWRRRLASCVPAAAKTEAKLGWVSAEHRQEVARCVDLAERAAERWTVAASAFLTPPAARDALTAIRQACGDGDDAPAALAWGGYAQAERCRVVVGPRAMLTPSQAASEGVGKSAAAAEKEEDDNNNNEQLADGDIAAAATADPSCLILPLATRQALDEAEVVAACSVQGNFMFDPATHRDFLGSVLGTGISRDKVGDIVAVGERGAVVLLDPVLLEHLERELTSVRSVPVTVRPVPLSELRFPPPKAMTLKSVEASMRLDAVASAGFRLSRAKMADLIKQGDVKLQWKRATKASAEVKQGDTISVAGKGRLEVSSVSPTKNGRFAVEMVRRT